MKYHFFMQLVPDFGRLSRLVFVCLKAISYFTVFLFLWLVMFAVLYGLLGTELNIDTYQGLNHLLQLVIFSFEIGIGNISTVNSKYWVYYKEKAPLVENSM